MEGFHRRGTLAVPPTVPRKVVAGGGSKSHARHGHNVPAGLAAEAISHAPALPEDYRQIFGAASACAIPVLDLPPPSDSGHGFHGCSALDYLDIFGGFDGRDFAVSYEELFSVAAEESSGAGPARPPPSSDLDDPIPLSPNTRTSRGLKGMSCLEEEMPLSRVIAEWPSEDNVWSSSSGVADCLSHGAKPMNISHHTASWSSKDYPVNGAMDKSQVHAISRSTLEVENAEANKSNTRVDTDICFYPNGCKETTKGQHVKETVLSTSSCSNMESTQNDMKVELRPSKSEFSASRSAVCEYNEPFNSSNWSTVSRSDVVSAKLSNNHGSHEDFLGKKTEGKRQTNVAQFNVMSMKSGNDLKAQCIASEDIPANEALFSCSSSDHAASSSPESFPHHLTNLINFDAIDVSIVVKKSMSQSPSCASSQSSCNDNKTEEKQFNRMSKLLKNSPVNERHQLHISNSHSVSSCYHHSDLHGSFLTVSDIILRTQPSQGPPPARPPPIRPTPCTGLDVCRPSATCPNYGIVTGPTFKSHSFKQAVRDISPSPSDAEVNENSDCDCVASVVSTKEAMELAQAKLKNEKLSMEGLDNIQIDLKLGGIYGQGSVERNEDKTIQDDQRCREEVVFQPTQRNTGDIVNEFAVKKMMREFTESRQAANFKEKERNCGLVEQSLQEMQLEEVSEKVLGHEEIEKKLNVSEKYMECQKGMNNLKLWAESFDQDGHEKELEVTHVSHVSAEGIHLMITSKNQEDESFNCIKRDECAGFHECNKMEPEEPRLLFEQYKRQKSNITQWTFGWAENENELKTAHVVHENKVNTEKLNEIQDFDEHNGIEKQLKEIQKLPLSPGKGLQQKDAEPNISPVARKADNFEDSTVAARGDNKNEINENIKEVQVMLDPRQAILLGKQCHTCKAGQESLGKRGAEWLDETISGVHEPKEEVNKERMERELPKNLEEEKERERRQLQRNERARIKLDEKDGKRIELEEEKEGERIEIEEEKFGRRRGLEEEKEMDRRLEKEKEREKMFQDKKYDKMKYEREEKEKKFEVDEGESWKREEERESSDLDEDQEGKKLEEEEDGDGKMGGQKDGEKMVEVEKKRNLEDKERSRRKIEEKQRERRRMEQEREVERSMTEEEKKLERIISEEEKDREREREKEREAVKEAGNVEAFVEAQERAQRIAVEMVTAECQHRALAEETVDNTSSETLDKSLAEKISIGDRLRAEYTAVDREMAEALEHAVGMAVAEKTTHNFRECAEKFAQTARDEVKINANFSGMWDSDPQFQNLDASSNSCQRFSEPFHASTEKFEGSEVESSIRYKARMERHQRTVERVAKALAEKNMCDVIAQREQAERKRLAETLDADVRRWSNGKEGNLRALLSTLQYILGPESGWQPVPLTDVITSPAVKKTYRKAMLCVHPDKLQQRSATIQQKYICEKVFDLLQAAWNMFNSEEW